MDRREFVRLTGGAALLGFCLPVIRSRAVSAQEAAPFAALGLPEVKVSLSETGFELSTAETPAGWTVITFHSMAPPEANSTCDLMRVPDDVTVDEVAALLASAESETPDWFFATPLAGGPGATGGATVQAVVNLAEPGTWVLFSGADGLPPASLTVTGEAPSEPAELPLEPAVDVVFEDFSFSGLDEPIPAGRQIWRFTNAGEEPHHMVLFAVPEGSTAEQIVGAFLGAFTGTPTPNALRFDQLAAAGGCGDLSAGGVAWQAPEMAAGTYGAVCFAPDRATGMPHLMLGMASVFTVA